MEPLNDSVEDLIKELNKGGKPILSKEDILKAQKRINEKIKIWHITHRGPIRFEPDRDKFPGYYN